MTPTLQERYEALRKNAEAFVESMTIMVASLERDGKTEEALHHRVWSLMPWQAAIAADDSGDLWPICEACGKPIKGETVSGGECDLHPACAEGAETKPEGSAT